MDISHVTDFIEARYKGTEISPEQIESKIRTIVTALDIFDEPEGMRIRYSFGTPVEDESALDDWKEDFCKGLSELPEEVKSAAYTVYEIWYDGDPDFEDQRGVEVMFYKSNR